jgi:uncharacterized membrane protein YecN with MAPEG domain
MKMEPEENTDMDALIKAGNGNALAFAASYSGLYVLFGVFLAFRVIFMRRTRQIGIGDGGERDLARHIRAHGNFSEYAPLLIGLLILLPLLGAKEWLVHLVGLSGLAGRVLHGFGLSRSAGPSFGRVAGMLLTFSGLLTGATGVIILAWGY